MKVFPLETTNKFNVLVMEETQDKCFLKPKPNCSAKIEKEIMLRVGLRTIDSHEVEEVDMLLDSGATGLFIDRTWLHQKKITT